MKKQEDKEMKSGLVLEGGGTRGIYTAGILDVFLEYGIEFDGVIGVSAGYEKKTAFLRASWRILWKKQLFYIIWIKIIVL